MTLEQFVHQFTDAIQAEPTSLRPGMRLADIAEFDSMGRLCVMSMIDSRFGFVISAEQLNQIPTIQDLFEFARAGANLK